MSDTHINAFFMDVDEKQKAFDTAQAELEAAKQRLADKKEQDGFVEPEEEKTEVKESKEEKVQVHTNKK